VVFILRRTRRRFHGGRVFRRSGQNPQTAAADFYAETLLFLKARGFIPEKAQTPMEFAQSFARIFHGNSDSSAQPAAALLELTRFYYEVRFGGHAEPFPHDEACALLRSLKTSLGK
jgi:hypothetical protein